MERQDNRPIRMKRDIRKPSSRKQKVLERRKCDHCGKKFHPKDMLVKHRPIKYMYAPNVDSEGMPVVEFERLYSDRRKRPFQDRKCNVLIVCGPCFGELKKRHK